MAETSVSDEYDRSLEYGFDSHQNVSGVWRNGKRAGLRSLWPKGLEGSIPSSPTKNVVDNGSLPYMICTVL